MQLIEIPKLLSFDDVLIEPAYSDLKTRSEVDLRTKISDIELKIPIISANMDSTTEVAMAKAMREAGGLGILHRYADSDTICKWITILTKNKLLAVPSVGIQDNDFNKVEMYENAGATAICVDIAHAHNFHAIQFIKGLKATWPKLTIIAGNVSTYEGVCALAEAGANVVKVGQGNGSACSTRFVTGHGVLQFSAIMECARAKEDLNEGYRNYRDKVPLTIIADGSVRTSGDIVKALAAGADAVMIGGLLAGCDECPDFDLPKWDYGATYLKKVKLYRGMASEEAQKSFLGKVNNNCPEGKSIGEVPRIGSVKNVLEELAGGIRSGLSYSGCKNIKEFQREVVVRVISNTRK